MSFSRSRKNPDEQFYRACLTGDTATVRKFLGTEEGRPSRSATDLVLGYGHVPLYLALFGGRRDTVLLLSERGAGFSARCALPGKAPLTGAASGGDPALVRLCLERGAEIDGRPESPDLVSSEKKLVYDSRFDRTETPLIAACRRLHLAAARLLLERGANADLAGNNGHSPLYVACRSNRVDFVRSLLEAGACSTLYHRGFWFMRQGEADHDYTRIYRLFRKSITLMVRKYVIGGNAEHPSRNRMRHLAPHIASFVTPRANKGVY